MNGNEQEFITPASILAYAGASFVVNILSNTVRVFSQKKSRLITLLISIFVSFLSTYISVNNGSAEQIDLYSIFIENVLNSIFAIINGCLLFLSALGLQTTLTNTPPVNEQQAKRRIKWFDKW